VNCTCLANCLNASAIAPLCDRPLAVISALGKLGVLILRGNEAKRASRSETHTPVSAAFLACSSGFSRTRNMTAQFGVVN
jgi:hypothetical protein